MLELPPPGFALTIGAKATQQPVARASLSDLLIFIIHLSLNSSCNAVSVNPITASCRYQFELVSCRNLSRSAALSTTRRSLLFVSLSWFGRLLAKMRSEPRSSSLVYMARPPSGARGHSCFGRPQYNSTPFPSGSFAGFTNVFQIDGGIPSHQ